PPPCRPLFPYTTLFRSCADVIAHALLERVQIVERRVIDGWRQRLEAFGLARLATDTDGKQRAPVKGVVEGDDAALLVTMVVGGVDRKSTRLNSSHVSIS